MLRTIILTILFAFGSNAMAIGETPKSEIKLGVKDKCSEACYVYNEKTIYTQSCTKDGPSSLSVGFIKKSGPSTELCKEASHQLVLKNIENATYSGSTGDLVFIEDSMSSPGEENLHIYSLSEGKKKISIGINDEPVNLVENKLKYFRAKEEVLYKTNPKRWKELGCDDTYKESLGCKLLVETELDLSTFKETTLKKTKVSSVQ